MKITTEYIKSLKPCEDRLNNYLQHYADREFELKEFFELDKITPKDKYWVGARILNKNQKVKWAIKCALSVYHIYKKDNQNDVAVIDLLNLLQSIDDFTSLSKDIINLLREKHNAAAAVAASAAAYAAYAAASAAADAASAAAYAAYVAYYAAYVAANAAYYADNAAYYAAYAVADAAAAKIEQEKKNLQFLLEIYEGK